MQTFNATLNATWGQFGSEEHCSILLGSVGQSGDRSLYMNTFKRVILKVEGKTWVSFELKCFDMKLIFELPRISATTLHCGRSLGKFGSFWWEHLKPLVGNSGIGNWLWVFNSTVELYLLDEKMLNYISQLTCTFSCSSLLQLAILNGVTFYFVFLILLISSFSEQLFPYMQTTNWYSILFKSDLHFGVSFFLTMMELNASPSL